MSTDAVRQHYGTAPLWDRVQAALAEAGLDGRRVEWSEFAPLDEFHTRGLPATRELAQALDPGAGTTVLDVGSGLGGPARLLAADHGCEVTGIDLSSEFINVVTRLTERAGLGFDEVWFQDQSALATEWFAALVGGAGPSVPTAIGLPVVMGPEFPQMAANLYENLREGRAGVIALVVSVPASGAD